MSPNRVPDLGHDYRAIKRIGSGAFGEVWQAESQGGVVVAAKIITTPYTQDEAQCELKALGVIKNLRHPFLAQTHDFWKHNDRLVIIMELADGNLRKRLRECVAEGKPGIPPDELLRYFREAADALDYLHEQNVLHRDIKPDNLLLQNRHVKVADFGLVRAQGQAQLIASMSICGTPGYMPPEVWEGKAGPASDQYSLACTYVELRLNRPIFPIKNFLSMMGAHQRERPDLAPLGEAEQAVLLQALDKGPQNRFSGCVEMVERLEDALADVLPPKSARRHSGPRSKLPSGSTTVAPPEPPPPPPPSTTQAGVPPASAVGSSPEFRGIATHLAPADAFPPPESTRAASGRPTAPSVVRTPANAELNETLLQELPPDFAPPPRKAGAGKGRWAVAACVALGLFLPGLAAYWYFAGGDGPSPRVAENKDRGQDTPPPQPPKPKAVALLVGVRQGSAALPSFRFAESDVAHLGRVLKAAGHDKVVVLTQAHGQADPSRSPTAARARQELAQLLKGRNPGDAVLVVLAGHVVQLLDDHACYFVPEGAKLNDPGSLLSLGEVLETVGRSAAGSKTVLVECRQEPLDKNVAVALASLEKPNPWKLAVPAGVAVIFSCSGDANQAHVHARDPHGAFLSFVTRGVQGEADANGDGGVTAAELDGYLSRAVAGYTSKTYGSAQQPRRKGETGPAALARPSEALREYLRGEGLLGRKEYGEAAAAFARAARAGPGYVEALLGQARAHFQDKDLGKMLADCDAALKLDPACALAHVYRGDALAERDADAALAAYSKAIELEPGYAPAWNIRGAVWLEKAISKQDEKACSQAIDDFGQAVRLAPRPEADYRDNRCAAYYQRAQFRKVARRFEEALEDCNSAIELAPKNARLHFARGKIRAAQNNHREAEQDYTEAIRLDEQYMAAYEARAGIRTKLGKTAEARKDREKAAELKAAQRPPEG